MWVEIVHTTKEANNGRHVAFVGVELGAHEEGELWCYVWCLTSVCGSFLRQ